jgi:hypothetical protein
MKKYFGFTILLFFTTNLFAFHSKDSILYCPKSPFLQDFMERKGTVYPIFIHANSFLKPTDSSHIQKPQILLKNANSIFITFAGSARIYQLIGERTSDYVFERIDKSPNLNFNIGAYYFFYKEELYSYSGYGFWKNNGIMKIFNQKDQEWDIIAMQKEIYPQLFPFGNSWIDEKKGRLYVPYQSKINAGIIGNEHITGVIDRDAHVLDLQKWEWKETGKVTNDFFSLFNKTSFLVNTPRGQLFGGQNGVFLADHNKNEILQNTTQGLIQYMIQIRSDDATYFYNDHIYHYNPTNGAYDSINIDFKVFTPTSMKVTETNSGVFLWAISLMFPLFFVGYLYWERNNQSPLPRSVNSIPTKPFQINFTDPEKSLLSLLLAKTKTGKRASVAEVNYVLGLKDKQTGMQKKVRSDIFNSIQEKYMFLDNKIASPIKIYKSDSDKRFLEFALEPSCLEIIENHIA